MKDELTCNAGHGGKRQVRILCIVDSREELVNRREHLPRSRVSQFLQANGRDWSGRAGPAHGLLNISCFHLQAAFGSPLCPKKMRVQAMSVVSLVVRPSERFLGSSFQKSAREKKANLLHTSEPHAPFLLLLLC